MKNLDLKAAQALFFIILFLWILFSCSANAQTGDFTKMNGEPGEYKVNLLDRNLVIYHHGEYAWSEEVVDIDTSMYSSILVWTEMKIDGEVFTSKWLLYYPLNEGGRPIKNSFSSAYCYGQGLDPVHYR